MTKKILEYYETESGEGPFLNWLNKYDIKTKAIITKYLYRVANGESRKNIKTLKHGVFEIKIFYWAGLRVYFAEDGEKIILLTGGDKSSQGTDIKKAKAYWRSYDRKK